MLSIGLSFIKINKRSEVFKEHIRRGLKFEKVCIGNQLII